MTESTASMMFRQNWYLLLILVVLVAGLAGYAVLGGDGGSTEAAAPTAADGTSTILEPRYATEPRNSVADEAQAHIDDYEARLTADPEQDDAPALLFAAANLYKQKLMDYKSAAEKYQLILVSHPDWPQAKQVYPLLDGCFDKLDDREGKKWLYDLILSREPADSQEYIYAQMELAKL